MKGKKILSTVLCLVMVMFIMVTSQGCGKSNEKSEDGSTVTSTSTSTQTEVKKDPITIKMYYDGGTDDKGSITSLDDEVGQIIKEKLNIEIQFMQYSGDIQEIAITQLAANDWGDADIVNVGLPETATKYIEAGVLVNLDDYRDKLQNYYSYMFEDIPYSRYLDKKNGALYLWGVGSGVTSPMWSDISTRVDVLEACGWPNLDTTDDYIAFLKQAMQKFPETLGKKTIGMSFGYGLGGGVGQILASYLPRMSGYAHFAKLTALFNPETNKYETMVNNLYFKETMRFYNTMTREGLMDKEAWTDKFEQLEAKMSAGTCICGDFAWWMNTSVKTKLAEAGHPEIAYIETPIRLTLAKQENKKRYEPIFPSSGNFGILKTSKYADRIAELLNLMATEEMGIRCGWGLEGRDYTVVDGIRVPSEEIVNLTKSDPNKLMKKKGLGLYSNMFPVGEYKLTANGQSTTYWYSREILNNQVSPTQKKAYDKYGWETPSDYRYKNSNFEQVTYKSVNFGAAAALEASSDLGKKEQRISDYMTQQIPILINASTAEKFESIYQKMVKDVLAMDIESVVAQYQKQYNEMETKIKELATK